MLDTQEHLGTELIVCTHQHEMGFDIKDPYATREKVRNCIMRRWWKNLLCWHLGIFSDEIDVHAKLTSIAKSLWKQDIVDLLSEIKRINQILDNLVRASYMNWSYWLNDSIGSNSIFWQGVSDYIDELKMILKSSIDVERELNEGQRNRFNYLIKKIKLICKEVLETVVPSIN